MSEVAVVVLAGGEGTRIGGSKPLRMLHGGRLIDRALRQARSWSDIVAVSVREPAQVQPIDAPFITDEPDVGGPLAGLISALRFGAERGCEFVLTIPADMPFLPPDLLGRLRSEIGELSCAMAGSGGHRHPVCGLWRVSALSQVERYLYGEQRSLRGFASLVGARQVDWPGGPVDPFFNINSADDLSQAEGRALS